MATSSTPSSPDSLQPSAGEECRSTFLIGSLPDLSAVFEDLSCQIESYPDVPSAMEGLWRKQPDLVIATYPCLLPVRMASPESKVIVLGGNGGPERVVSAIRKQAYGFFAEPYDTCAIRDLVLQAIHEPGFDDGIRLISGDPRFLSLHLRCRISTADRLVRFLSQLRTDMPQDERNKAALAFREMLLNAIEHGGKFDPHQWVRVSRVRTDRTLVYHIQDPGEGFSRKHLEHAAVSNPENDPAKHMKARAESGLRPGGFGILMTSKLVDEVIYNEQGNEVILIKHFD